jgi:hypothetical protein
LRFILPVDRADISGSYTVARRECTHITRIEPINADGGPQTRMYGQVRSPWTSPTAFTDQTAVFGYLIGPTLGSSLFSLTHPAHSRGKPSPLEIMDRELFEHIKRNRVDPQFQSPVPAQRVVADYQITSLSTYRRWLRDQATYKRKAMHGVPGEGGSRL